METRMNHAVISMPQSGIRRVTEAARGIEGCISLALGEPSFDTPAAIRDATKRALDEGLTHYPPNAGLMALREHIAAHEGAHSGNAWMAENVLITSGSTEAIAAALFAVLEPGDEVIVPNPAFGLYAQQVILARGVCVPLHTAAHGFQIGEEALSALVTPRTKAILLNSPNNPTGVVYAPESIKAAVSACEKHNLFLIFDAVYDRLVYDGQMTYPSAKALEGRLIHCGAFSKTYAMTGWRMGYCMAETSVLRQMTKVHAALTVGVSTFSQAGCTDIFSVPSEAMRDAYRANRDVVCARLAKMGVEAVRPEGAFYAFPSIAGYGMDDERFVDRLMREARVALVPGSCFGTPGFARLSYCCDTATLLEGLDRLEGFVRGL